MMALRRVRWPSRICRIRRRRMSSFAAIRTIRVRSRRRTSCPVSVAVTSKSFRDGSGRLELARAIIDPQNPLTARVIVNRVWMHHFGFGLVRTPSDFGFRGDPPTHPELLDYLAVKFVESGWSLKKLHRLIMTSATYRQASADNEAARKIDPENQLLWRMNRRRLEIESLRDSMLAAAGRLDLTAGGVPFALTAQPSVPRRSVYGFIERGRVPASAERFRLRFAGSARADALRHDGAAAGAVLSEQPVRGGAGAARCRIGRRFAQPEAPSEKIDRLYRLVFSRAPEKRELEAGLQFVPQERRKQARVRRRPSPWQYGTGEFRADTGRVESFTPFPIFVPDRWQGGAALPAAHVRQSGR